MSNSTYKQDLHDISLAVATNCKLYCDESISNLKWQLGTYDLSVDTNTDTAHIKTLPSGAIQTTVAKVDGVGYKVNQLAKTLSDANWSTTNATATYSDGIATLTPTAQFGRINQYFNYEANHKLLIICGIKLSNATNSNDVTASAYGIDNIVGGNTACQSTTDWQNVSVILYSSSSSANNRFMVTDARTSDWGTTQIKNYIVFDLTTDFGSGNEPTSVSDCATAYLQRGINIYEYTPQQSSIKNNAFTGATVEGFNKWDEETRVQDNWLWSKNNIVCKPSTTYCFTAPSNGVFTFYDKNNNVIESDRTVVVSGGSATFTTPSNAYNMSFRMTSGYGTTYNHNICINISGSANGTYVPYIQPTTISVDLTTIKDSNNVSLFPSGKMMGNSSVADFITPYNQESRWAEYTFTGNETWTKLTSEGYDYYICSLPIAPASNASNYNVFNNLISNIDAENVYRSRMWSAIANTTAFICIAYNSFTISNYLYQNRATMLTGKILQYERATYLTSNTDLTSLTKINAQSNGTITLNNTDNVDMPNTIKSLKEVAK